MTKLSDTDPFPFGTHRNTPMQDVPASYLDWISAQYWIKAWPQVVEYITRNRKVIDAELIEQGKIEHA